LKISKEVKTALLALLAIALLIFGYNFLKGNNLLDNNRTFYAVYDDVEGLAPSSPVTINGLQVGTVSGIRFLNKTGAILVSMNVQNEFQFSKTSKAQIYGGGIIGGKSLAILPEYDGPIAKSGDTLPGEIDEGLLELVNDRLTPLQNKVEKAISSTDSVLFAFNDILNPESRQNLKQSLANFNSISENFKNFTGRTDNLLKNNEDKLSRTISNIDKTTANLSKLTDSLSQVDLAQITRDLEIAIHDFKSIANELNQGKGTAGKLLKDPTVYDNMDRATRQLEQLLQDLKLNPKRYVHFSLFGKKNKAYEKPKDSLK
jgi:phospholipid/cholesterol/gamma-HCH transport system substrate-binding protein